MRRILVALSAAALTIAIATPVLAAKPAKPATLTFDTHLTRTLDGQIWTNIPGNVKSGFLFVTGGDSNVAYTIGTSNTNAKPGLEWPLDANTPGGGIPFYLASTTADLTSYFAAKGWPQQYLDQINAEIAGDAPFFVLQNAGNGYWLGDGFKNPIYGLGCFPDADGNPIYDGVCVFPPGMNGVTIDDDYPVGTYVYSGHLVGTNGATLDLEIKLTVVRA